MSHPRNSTALLSDLSLRGLSPLTLSTDLVPCQFTGSLGRFRHSAHWNHNNNTAASRQWNLAEEGNQGWDHLKGRDSNHPTQGSCMLPGYHTKFGKLMLMHLIYSTPSHRVQFFPDRNLRVVEAVMPAASLVEAFIHGLPLFCQRKRGRVLSSPRARPRDGGRARRSGRGHRRIHPPAAEGEARARPLHLIASNYGAREGGKGGRDFLGVEACPITSSMNAASLPGT